MTTPKLSTEKLYKIRHKDNGLFKLSGFDWEEYEVPFAERYSEKGLLKQRFPGWSTNGKVWNRKQLAGHLGNFLRTNRPDWRTGELPRPDLERGATYYELPECYEIVEIITECSLVPIESVLRAGAMVTRV